MAENDEELTKMRAQLRAKKDQSSEAGDEAIRKAVEEAREAWKAEENKRILAARIEWRKEAAAQNARNAVARVASLPRRMPVLRYALRGGVLLGGVIGGGLLYSHVEPLVVDQLWPMIESFYYSLTY